MKDRHKRYAEGRKWVYSARRNWPPCVLGRRL